MAADMTVRGTPVVLTTDGQAWLEARLARARERLAHIEDELATERSEDLISERQLVREQIEELVPLLRNAVTPEEVRDDPTIVELGDQVEVEFDDGEREKFLIVHPVEAGMDEHRTASDAPLARAVLGRREGDRITVTSPAGVYHGTIVGHHRIG